MYPLIDTLAGVEDEDWFLSATPSSSLFLKCALAISEFSTVEDEIVKIRHEFELAKQRFVNIPKAINSMPKMNPQGSFVVIDHTGKEKAQESGNKVTSIVCKVLFFEQVCLLQKSPEWPEIFKDTKPIPANESSLVPIAHQVMKMMACPIGSKHKQIETVWGAM